MSKPDIKAIRARNEREIEVLREPARAFSTPVLILPLVHEDIPALCARVELLERLLKEACDLADNAAESSAKRAETIDRWQDRIAAIRSEGGV